MHSIVRILFFSAFVFLFCPNFLSAEQPVSEFNTQAFKEFQVIIDDFLVNDDTTGEWYQQNPDIAVGPDGSFIIVWEDGRKENLDVYAQRYNQFGTPLGSNFRVNDDTGSGDQYHPVVAIDGDGDFVIAWIDQRNYEDYSYSADIYAQRYNSAGNPRGSNFKVNEDTAAYHGYDYPAVAMDYSGRFVITWKGWRSNSYDWDIFAQIYRSSGTRFGLNFKVNPDTGLISQLAPSIAIDTSDADHSFIIAWVSHHNIYARRYDLTYGNPVGDTFIVDDDTGAIDPATTGIATDGLGNLFITWDDLILHAKIYVRRFNSSGIPLGPSFAVDDTAGYDKYFPSIAIRNSGEFIIAYQERPFTGGDSIYASRYDSSGNLLNNRYFIPNFERSSTYFANPEVAAIGSKVYFCWYECNHTTGWDIYAKVVDWDWTDVEEEQMAGLPESFELAQNYPNPFNPSTRIQFRVGSLEFAEPAHTTLIIYNILGQKVRMLLDEEKLPGSYNVIWDGKDDSGKDVASGIYFYQLRAKDYTETRKMALLR